MDFFEVKVKYDKVLEDGKEKRVSETYAIDATSFTEAEAIITKEMQPYITGDFFVAAEKRAQYDEVVLNMGDIFFLVKYVFITRDELGKEHRTAQYVLFRDHNIDGAKESAREHMRQTPIDYEIESIKETKILDAFLRF